MKDVITAEKRAAQKKDAILEGPLFSSILIFVIPIILANVMQTLFNAVDMVMVNFFSVGNEVASIGCTNPLLNLFKNLSLGISVGTSIMLARYLGAGEADKAKKTVRTSILAALLIGAVIASQIVLIYLLKTSRLFHRDGPVPTEEGENPKTDYDGKNGRDPDDKAMQIFDDSDDYPAYAAQNDTDAWQNDEDRFTDAQNDGETIAVHASGWRFDPETGEIFEENGQDSPKEEEQSAQTEDPAEDDAYEDEIYVEPDITGDEAPAPDGFYYEDD